MKDVSVGLTSLDGIVDKTEISGLRVHYRKFTGFGHLIGIGTHKWDESIYRERQAECSETVPGDITT
jgi:hypothetical protein